MIIEESSGQATFGILLFSASAKDVIATRTTAAKMYGARSFIVVFLLCFFVSCSFVTIIFSCYGVRLKGALPATCRYPPQQASSW